MTVRIAVRIAVRVRPRREVRQPWAALQDMLQCCLGVHRAELIRAGVIRAGVIRARDTSHAGAMTGALNPGPW